MNVSSLKVHVKVSEIHSIAGQISLAISNAAMSSDGNLTTILDALQTKTDEMTKSVNHSKVESDLAEKDEQRDFIVRGVSSSLQSAQFSFDENVKKASEKVSIIFDKYGVAMVGESYAVESSLIKAFLQDISADEVQSAIQAIPFLPDLIERLEASQNTFDEAENAWNITKSTESVSATSIKKELLNIINNQIVTYLTALSAVNPAYKDIASEVDEIIKTANRNIHRK